MIQTRNCKIKIIILIAVCVFSLFCIDVNGMEFPEESSIGLDFSEMSNVIELHKGETYKNFFTVTNTSDYPITFNTEIMPYTTVDNEGGISLKVNTSETEITKWTQVFWGKEITLEPGEERKISYVIDVPEDCRPGEQKEAIMLNALTPNKYGIINSNGYLIYANVVDTIPILPIVVTICLSVVLLIGICVTIALMKNSRRKPTKKKKSFNKKH